MGSGPEVPCSQSQHRPAEHVTIPGGRGGGRGAHLQADGQIDPAAEGRADGARVEAQVLEELGEGVGQRHPGTLLRHHDAGPDPGQVQPPSLDTVSREGEDPSRGLKDTFKITQRLNLI